MTRCAFAGLLWLWLLPLGCHTVPVSAGPDPLVEELFEAGKKNLGTLVSSDPVLREVPLGMPMDMARTIMEKHGFSCWAAVQDDKGTYLRCIAYKSSPRPYKICINLYYDPRRNNITGVDTVVDYDTWHGLHGT